MSFVEIEDDDGAGEREEEPKYMGNHHLFNKQGPAGWKQPAGQLAPSRVLADR